MKKSVFFLLAIFVIIGLVMVVLVKQNTGLSESENTAQSDLMNNNLGTPAPYEHPVLGYSLEYPSDWTGGTQEIPPGIDQDYQDFQIFSPDFNAPELNDAKISLGSSILIRTENFKDLSLKDWQAKQSNSPKDVKRLMVNHRPAIQYTFSDKNSEALETSLVFNKVLYLIRFRFANDYEMKARMSIYTRLLKSLKFSN